VSARILPSGVVRITIGARSTDYRVGPLPGGTGRREFWLENVRTLDVLCVHVSADGERDYCDCRAGMLSGRCCHVAALRKLLDRGRLSDRTVTAGNR
jgi:hypothetical protein